MAACWDGLWDGFDEGGGVVFGEDGEAGGYGTCFVLILGCERISWHRYMC